MLCRADTVGVFQIESRAQMATLPRLRPRKFYDLVVEVALIRPGPIQGGSVHPYIRRRNGQEEVTYLHPLLENGAEQDARRAAVPGAADADGHRRRRVHARPRPTSCARRWAPSAAAQRMERLRQRLYDGMAERGITGEIADELFVKMAAFANYGFPESHSVSFAYLVYSSSWLKFHEPAAFCAALINAQPMGFWSPHTLDAGRPPPRRGRAHTGPQRLPALATLEPCPSSTGGVAVRLGIGSVRGVGSDLGQGDRGRPAVLVDRGVGARRAGADRWPSWRRWPPPGCSASASAWRGGRRCGRWARPCSRGRGACPASSSAPRRRRCRA